MNLNKISVFALTLILISTVLTAQKDLEIPEIKKFADILFQEKDYLRAAIEYERYLYYADDQPDSVLFKLGLCHQMRQKYDYATKYFKKVMDIENSILSSQARQAYLYNLYKSGKFDSLKKIAKFDSSEVFYYYAACIHADENIEWQKFELSEKQLTKFKQLDSQRINKKEKSPLLAGILSAVIPGMGKIYLKRTGDGLYSLGLTGLSAAVTARAFIKDLVVTGVVGSGITLTFYLGNIYGSYVGAKIYNKQLDKNFYADLETLNPVNQNPYWEKWIEN